MGWKDQLWAELNEKDAIEQITLTGLWITDLTQEVLPRLGNERRQAVLSALATPGMDATRLAEMIGSRRSTITRLAEEGRAHRRELNIKEAAEYAARVAA